MVALDDGFQQLWTAFAARHICDQAVGCSFLRLLGLVPILLLQLFLRSIADAWELEPRAMNASHPRCSFRPLCARFRHYGGQRE